MMIFSQLIAALPVLLHAYWLLAIFAATVALVPIPFMQEFRNAVLLSACRGKLMDIKPKSALGPLSHWTVPQRWFSHFYLVGAIWNLFITALFLSSSYYASSLQPTQATYALALILIEIHLLRRFLETLFIMKYPSEATMHGIAYLFGMSYYLIVPLTIIPSLSYASMIHAGASILGLRKNSDMSIVPMKNIFSTLSSLFRALQFSSSSSTPPIANPTLNDAVQTIISTLVVLPLKLTKLTAPQWVGMIIFLFGNLLQYHSHSLLARLASSNTKKNSNNTTAGMNAHHQHAPSPLRKGRSVSRSPMNRSRSRSRSKSRSRLAKTPNNNSTGIYKIPRGGFFELVSCPHYFAEIVIYFGLALLESKNTTKPYYMLIWVVVNLSLAAGLTHAWYKDMFREEYPKKRKALLPFLF